MDVAISDKGGLPEEWFKSVAEQYSRLPGRERNKLLKCLIENSDASEIAYLEYHFKRLQYRDFICHLPSYIVEMLLTYLDVKTLCRCREISRNWKSVIDSCDRTWRKKCQHLGFNLDSPKTKMAFETGSENYRSWCIRMIKMFDDMANGRCFKVKTFRTFSHRVRAVALWKKTLAACFEDLTIAVWDVQTRTLLSKTKLNCSLISCAKIHDTTLLVGTCDGFLFALDCATLAVQKTFSNHCGCVNDIAFNSWIDVAISGSTDQTVKIWSLAEGKLMSTFIGHNQWVLSVSLNPIPEKLNGFQLDSVNVASIDLNNIIVWRLTTHEIIVKIHPSLMIILGVHLDEDCVWYITRQSHSSARLRRYNYKAKYERGYPDLIGQFVRLLAVTTKYAWVISHKNSLEMRLYELRNMAIVATWTITCYPSPPTHNFGEFATGDMQWMHGFDGFNHRGVIAAWGNHCGEITKLHWI